MFDWEKTYVGQVAHASDKYLNGAPAGSPVEADQDDREALDDSAHDEVTNSELHTLADPYEGGAIVETDDDGFVGKVFDVVQAGDTFAFGGPIAKNFVTDADYSSGYVDFSVLAEASKETGEPHF